MTDLSWPRNPIIYEINTRVWLEELGHKHEATITLASVPTEEWDTLAALGFDAVWLMGVWERSALGRRIALDDAPLLADVRRVVPDLVEEDLVGSPYSVRRYSVDARLGGSAGLAVARRELARRGVRLILDYVPNHVAPDNPWIESHPEFFIRGAEEDLRRDPTGYVELGGDVFARGKDPNFPAWQDTVQVNAFNAGLRAAQASVALEIAEQCDGLRCDMPMLVMNSVLERTWGARAGSRPEAEYWPSLIDSVKERHPDTLFLAEAYWDLESELLGQGFDICYDKRLYDRLAYEDAESVRQHLLADASHQSRLLRFVENHDEPRAATAFPGERGRAAAVAAYTVPGAKLLHEGQLDGRQARVPVFLGRRPVEQPDASSQSFYRSLLTAIRTRCIGEWRLAELRGWPDNESWRNLVAWTWWSEGWTLVVVNLSPVRSQARVRIALPESCDGQLTLHDLLSDRTYERNGGQIRESGLFVDLEAWGVHFLTFEPVPEARSTGQPLEETMRRAFWR